MIFAFVRGHLAADFPLRVACEVLGVSRPGYYAWRERPASAWAQRREAAVIARVHAEDRGVYGSPRGAPGPGGRGL